MSRAFRRIRPRLCLLMELEVWPNFVRIAKGSGIPVVVVNGRISDRSFRSYMRVRRLIKTMFSKVTLVLAQTEEYGRRFRDLGCGEESVIVSGSLKYDTAQTQDKVEGTDALAEQIAIGDGRLWVLGGTGNDEEALLLDVYEQLKNDERFGDLRVAVVPRKPERFDEVATLISQRGLKLIRYSEIKSGQAPTPSDKQAVILGDTMGDLVGRSLVAMGGSDMMEAAALGKCTMFGPHAFNFRQTVDALLCDNGAIMVKDKEELGNYGQGQGRASRRNDQMPHRPRLRPGNSPKRPRSDNQEPGSNTENHRANHGTFE